MAALLKILTVGSQGGLNNPIVPSVLQLTHSHCRPLNKLNTRHKTLKDTLSSHPCADVIYTPNTHTFTVAARLKSIRAEPLFLFVFVLFCFL